jgi:hypothetical protein
MKGRKKGEGEERK